MLRSCQRSDASPQIGCGDCEGGAWAWAVGPAFPDSDSAADSGARRSAADSGARCCTARGFPQAERKLRSDSGSSGVGRGRLRRPGGWGWPDSCVLLARVRKGQTKKLEQFMPGRR